MPTIKDFKLGGKIFQLSIGYPGVGKTVGAGSYPKPIMFHDLDQRVAPLAKMFPGAEDIHYEQFGPYDFLRYWERINQLKMGNAPYKTYVVDSLIALARMTLNYAVSLRVGEKRTTEYKKKGVIDLLEIEDYGAESRLLGHVIDVFRSLRSNFILNAHLVHTTEKDIKTKKETEYKTLLTGGKKIAAEIPSYFDEVYYFYTRDTVVDGPPDYFISTVPMDDIKCKTALPLPPTIRFTMNEKEKGVGLFQRIQEECRKNGVEIG